MDTAPRQRTKPLRTYGKRTSSTPDRGTEVFAKKRRIDSPKAQAETVSTPMTKGPKDTDAPSEAPAKATVAIAKGSIMNFFKPLPPTSSSPSPSSPKRDANSISTLPSSPPVAKPEEARRKPRILRFRGASMPSLGTDDADQRQEGIDEPEAAGDEDTGRDQGNPQRRTLQVRRSSQSEEPCTKPDRSNPKKPRPKPSSAVQMTLNISAQAAFSECKICDTVWNPLFPDDVKYHTKRHASVLRAKKNQMENEL